MTIIEVAQRTQEWHAARVGRLNSSDAGDMLAMNKSGGESASRRDLRVRLACERLTGTAIESGYINAEMQRGISCEPIARAFYEAETGAMVQEIGYVQHDELLAGYSPDGFVGADGLLEIKVPKTATHVRYLRDGKLPADYVAQCQHALFVSERQWIDFVSFDDRLPEALQFFRVRLTREEAKLDVYERTLRAFLAEVQNELEALQTLRNLRQQFAAAVEASA